MTKKMYFTVMSRLPGLNEYIKDINNNRFKGNKLKQNTEEMISSGIYAALLRKTLKRVSVPVYISFFWHEKTRRRDPDNVVFAKKFILDALQKCGILHNDCQKYIKGFKDEIVYDGEDFVYIEIFEAPDTGKGKK